MPHLQGPSGTLGQCCREFGLQNQRRIVGSLSPPGTPLAWRTRPGYRGEGWPTCVLNEGRQLLFGNVGDRVLEANIRELLREPAAGAASRC